MITRPILVGGFAVTSAFVTLLDATLKSSLLLLAALILLALLRKSSAALRHAILAGALCITLILPVLCWFAPRWSLLPSWLSVKEIPVVWFASSPAKPKKETQDTALTIPQSQVMQNIDQPVRATPVIRKTVEPTATLRLRAASTLRVWGVVSMAMIFFALACGYRLRMRKRHSHIVTSGPLLDCMEHSKRELAYSGKIALCLDPSSQLPSCWGVWQPTIMLPSESETWSPQRLRSVMLHEVAHIKRRDPMFLMIAFTALSLQWFNPFFWLAWRTIRKEQERACDDLVLTHGVKSSDYAADMLDIAQSFCVSTSMPMQLNMARSSGMESRIDEILDENRQRKGPARRTLQMLAASSLVLCLIVASLAAAPKKIIPRGSIKDRHGVTLVTTQDNKRQHPYGALAAHVLGYSHAGKGYGGVEEMLNVELSEGKHVNLTIDARMQAMCERVLRESEIGRGAVVVMDPNTGDILSMASVPNYEPQLLHQKIEKEQWEKLSRSATFPLMNRAITNADPGSTFMLFAALAAAEQGISNHKHTCNGYVQYGNHKASCWIWNQSQGKHGELDLPAAIHNSCNPYFYKLSMEIGVEGFRKTTRHLGWNQPSLGLGGERPPRLVTEQTEYPCTPVDLAMISIGQGISSASPLHIAQLTSTIANGGKVFIPRIDAASPIMLKTDLVEQGVQPEGIALIREGMRRAVQEVGGTAGHAKSDQIQISAKTGTAQSIDRGKRSNNAWCTAFAPSDEPRYVVTVVVIGGKSGGKVGGPIVREILENIETLPELTAQPVNAGHLESMEEVDPAKFHKAE
jgi:beta-lactamase regulating signal transducer with metallopeptidase domain/beta-lactamase class D